MNKIPRETLVILEQLTDAELAEHGYGRLAKLSAPPDIDMDKLRPETVAAIDWWAYQFTGPPKMDNGDAFQTAFGTFVAGQTHTPLRLEQVDLFRKWLAWIIERVLMNPDRWKSDDPMWGSYHRILSVDYGPDQYLAGAASLAGIYDYRDRFPIKTLMRIDPGSVTVSCGYGAKDQSL